MFHKLLLQATITIHIQIYVILYIANINNVRLTKNNHTSTMAAVLDRGTVSLKNEINVEKINYDF